MYAAQQRAHLIDPINSRTLKMRNILTIVLASLLNVQVVYKNWTITVHLSHNYAVVATGMILL